VFWLAWKITQWLVDRHERMTTTAQRQQLMVMLTTAAQLPILA
jgi:hypothetical protein